MLCIEKSSRRRHSTKSFGMRELLRKRFSRTRSYQLSINLRKMCVFHQSNFHFFHNPRIASSFECETCAEPTYESAYVGYRIFRNKKKDSNIKTTFFLRLSLKLTPLTCCHHLPESRLETVTYVDENDAISFMKNSRDAQNNLWNFLGFLDFSMG